MPDYDHPKVFHCDCGLFPPFFMNPLASNRLTEEVIPIIPGAANKYSEEGSQATQTRIAAKLVTIPTPIPLPRTRLRLGIRHQLCLCSARAPRTYS